MFCLKNSNRRVRLYEKGSHPCESYRPEVIERYGEIIEIKGEQNRSPGGYWRGPLSAPSDGGYGR